MPANPPPIFTPTSPTPPAAPGAIYTPTSATPPGAPGAVFVPAVAAATASLLVSTNNFGTIIPNFLFTSKAAGAGGNSTTVRFVGTADPNPLGPYPPAAVTSIVVTGSNVVLNWQPSQNLLLPSVVQAALFANSAASALLTGTALTESSIITWPAAVTALTGGVGTALASPPTLFVPATGGSPSNPSAIFAPTSPTPPGAPGAIFAPTSPTPPGAPGAIFTPPSNSGGVTPPPPIFGTP